MYSFLGKYLFISIYSNGFSNFGYCIMTGIKVPTWISSPLIGTISLLTLVKKDLALVAVTVLPNLVVILTKSLVPSLFIGKCFVKALTLFQEILPSLSTDIASMFLLDVS